MWDNEIKNLHFEPGWHVPVEKKGPYENRIKQYKGRFVGKDNKKGANVFEKRRENTQGHNQPFGKIHEPEKEINFDEFKNFIFGLGIEITNKIVNTFFYQISRALNQRKQCIKQSFRLLRDAITTAKIANTCK